MGFRSILIAIAVFLFLLAFAFSVDLINGGNEGAIAYLGLAAFAGSFVVPPNR